MKHDARLYTTQILLALASSPLPWSGTNGFSIIGYSLGGGISASFTDTFPNLVQSLVLVTPSGIVKQSHIAWSSKFLYQTEGILPEPLVDVISPPSHEILLTIYRHYLVRQRLRGDTVASPSSRSKKTDPAGAVAAETGGHQEANENDSSPRRASSIPETALFPYRPIVNITSAVQWQLQHHYGFVPAFISAIRNAPITNQHESWKRIGSRLSTQKANSANQQAMNNGLWRSKVLLLLGRTDPIIIPKEVEADATECFGHGNLETVIIDGGHDIPTSNAKDVAIAILRFWGEYSDRLESAAEVEVETGT
jgi:pimeloyl-ACP methyl ester carboxylesterase